MIFKKKRENYFEFFNYDLELEKEIKSMSKIGVVRIIKKRVLNNEDYDFFEDEKQRNKGMDN